MAWACYWSSGNNCSVTQYWANGVARTYVIMILSTPRPGGAALEVRIGSITTGKLSLRAFHRYVTLLYMHVIHRWKLLNPTFQRNGWLRGTQKRICSLTPLALDKMLQPDQ